MTDTRARLLDATRRCIGANGLAGTTSRDIASSADANLAAITYHFGSKEELVAQALLEGLRAWLAPTIEVLGTDTDPAVRAALAIQTLTATFQEQKQDASGYLQALIEAPRIQPLHDGVIRLWAELRSLLAAQMTQMQDRGELDGWVDPDAMAGVLVAVANGLVLHVTVDPGGPALEDMVGQFGSLLLGAHHTR
ncbi:MAG: TetR/AcrR family transcriptional regulator [Acidimicrobiales bacterium]